MTDDRLKSIWPEWRLEDKPLGVGSYGAVYKAVRNDHGVESASAIKIISIPRDEAELDSLFFEGLTVEASRTYLEEVVNDYVGEIRMMESFKGTQNIVSIEDYKVVEKAGGIGWDIFIRMELLTSFKAYASEAELSEKEAVKLGLDICSALELLERKNVIHRDIKPQNIFINEFGDFKLGDFGIARDIDSSLSARGTPSYMAPEVVMNKHYDARADIYSLGMVLYTVMNRGRLPFLDVDKPFLLPEDYETASKKRLSGAGLPPPCNASPDFSEIILCACSADPETRFFSATALKHALLSLDPDSDTARYTDALCIPDRASGEKKPSKNASVKKKTPVKRSLAFAAVLGALLLAAVLFTVGLLFGKNRSGTGGPEASDDEPYESTDSTYAAYLKHLNDNRGSIELYSWQNGWNGTVKPTGGNAPRSICFADIWGDAEPEMIYIDAYGKDDNGSTYYSRIHILSCMDGALVTLFDEDWDSLSEPKNYAIHMNFNGGLSCVTYETNESTGVEYLITCYDFITDLSNKLSMDKFFAAKKWAQTGTVSYEEFIQAGTQKLDSAETYISSYSKAVSAVLLSGGESPELKELVRRESIAMTCDEAAAWLKTKLRSENEPRVGGVYPSPIEDTMTFLRGIQLRYFYPGYESNPKFDFEFTVGYDGLALGSLTFFFGPDEFSFRLEDIRKESESCCSFRIKGLKCSLRTRILLHLFGFRENAVLYIYPAGTESSDLPDKLLKAINDDYAFSYTNGLPFYAVYSESSGIYLQGSQPP